VARLTWKQDTFASADSYVAAAGRYRGLEGGRRPNVQLNSRIDPSNNLPDRRTLFVNVLRKALFVREAIGILSRTSVIVSAAYSQTTSGSDSRLQCARDMD
jgi:hypothetical protein